MLKYALRENLLTPEPDDYMAQTVDARSYSGEEIVELMPASGAAPSPRQTRRRRWSCTTPCVPSSLPTAAT